MHYPQEVLGRILERRLVELLLEMKSPNPSLCSLRT
jgi:hypothetical protein